MDMNMEPKSEPPESPDINGQTKLDDDSTQGLFDLQKSPPLPPNSMLPVFATPTIHNPQGTLHHHHHLHHTGLPSVGAGGDLHVPDTGSNDVPAMLHEYQSL